MPDGDSDRCGASGIKSHVRQIAQHVSRCVEALAVAMFALVFMAFIYKIVMRYAAGDAVAWADEVSVVCSSGWFFLRTASCLKIATRSPST